MAAEVHLERRAEVAVVTVSDPDRRNALTLDLADELVATVAGCEADETVGALVVTGAPPAFCAGADRRALAEAGEHGGSDDLRRVYEGFLAVARCRLPTVAAVNGPAVGAGLNLALACDVRIVGPSARFDARFLQLGIHPGGGMTWMLQRAVGPQTAAAMTLFSEVLGAQDAVRTGLAYRLADTGPAGDDRQRAHDIVVRDAVGLAARAAAASRELAVATKHSLADTAAMHDQAEAVDREVDPQVASLRGAQLDPKAFAARVEEIRATVGRPDPCT